MNRLTSTNVDHYKAVLGRFCTGVTVVTSLYEGKPVGFTCQSFCALSLEPPLVLLCLQKTSTTWPKIRRSGRLAINVLGEHQQAIGRRFGRTGIDRFAGVEWRPSPAGMPLLSGTLAWLECRLTEEIDAGDHTIAVAAVDELGTGPAQQPLLFFQGRFVGYDVKEAMSA
ncbi:flavin reductase family protein [Thermostaphylospora chromogena]|uniref:3-hydroxy-9,10-secoandrosta-1,3,5(10)-triene-9,17-dione monooxygenase reductase component n=1 Tax=Thermostaphylospora chromogena TaxID=35622 RepID=A0A1H1D0U1_9ACTN|nr:flavin reductase family protein [Thermostaphylospora chromogena]SDQ70093.1 3-hydroxy-9,10-secoandrosta-1,3,5(10)-triene-9,17-dione monooxygenase reductase component [Thermostaphylospora chromogena]